MLCTDSYVSVKAGRSIVTATIGTSQEITLSCDAP